VISGPVNLGGLVSVKMGPLTPVRKHHHKVRGRFQQTVTIINTCPDVVDGPIALVLDHLMPRKKVHHHFVPRVRVLNASGTTSSVSPGSPYVAMGAAQLQPGEQMSFTLNFKVKGAGHITFNPIPLAGFAQP
jgi:hypothetical protein